MPDEVTAESASSLATHKLVYRLIKERFLATPLSAEGARRFGGPWNPVGIGILYTSASPELTLLEQLVHLPTLPYEDLPRLHLVTLALPESSRMLRPDKLPATWRDVADFTANHKLLANWLRLPEGLAIGVLLAVVPDSLNYLIHSGHPAFEQVSVVGSKPFPLDPRLWRSNP